MAVNRSCTDLHKSTCMRMVSMRPPVLECSVWHLKACAYCVSVGRILHFVARDSS